MNKITRTVASVTGLETFIKFYKPQGWVGPIHEFTFAPYITDQELETILRGEIPAAKKFEPFYIKETIRAWLDLLEKKS